MDQQNGSAWTEDRVIGVIRGLAEEEDLPDHLKGGTISGTDTVETLGIDSIGAVALVDRLEEEAGVPLPDDFLELEDNIAAIVARLNGMS